MVKRHQNGRDGVILIMLGWATALFVAVAIIANKLFKLNQYSSRPIEPVLIQEPQEIAVHSIEKDNSPFRFWNWDVVGLTSVAVTIVGAAIFYVAGWVYEANWYGFYSIEVSQIGLVPNQVMLQGFPGIFLVLIGLILSVTWQYLRNTADWLYDLLNFHTPGLWLAIISPSAGEPTIPRIPNSEFREVILRAYIWAFLIIAIFALYARTLESSFISWEMLITLVPGAVITILVAFVSDAYELTRLAISTMDPDQPVRISTRLRYLPFWLAVLLFRKRFSKEILETLEPEIQNDLERKAIENEKFRKAYFLLAETVGMPKKEHIRIADVLQAVARLLDRTITGMLSRFSGFWLPLVLTLLFLISISASAVLGKFDALRGARSLSGNWHMPITYLYSNEKIVSLAQHEQSIGGGFRYGPLGLIANTSTRLYLTRWKLEVYFKGHPPLYVIPVRSELSLDLAQPTPKPFPSATPTMRPTQIPQPTPELMLTPEPKE